MIFSPNLLIFLNHSNCFFTSKSDTPPPSPPSNKVDIVAKFMDENKRAVPVKACQNPKIWFSCIFVLSCDTWFITSYYAFHISQSEICSSKEVFPAIYDTHFLLYGQPYWHFVDNGFFLIVHQF